MKQILKKLILKRKYVKVEGSVKGISVNCIFGKNIEITESVIFPGCNIGDYTYLNRCSVFSGNIGRFCSIGYGSIIGPSDHPLNIATTHPILYDSKYIKYNKELNNRQLAFKQSEPPCIEDNVWIGANAIILRGTNIGEGSVIAAGAIVTKDVEPYTIVAGVPARKIKALSKIIDFKENNTNWIEEFIVNYLKKGI